jgi:hypothetical protein
MKLTLSKSDASPFIFLATISLVNSESPPKESV